MLHKGTLREMGTHQELLALGGIYYKLYQLQYKVTKKCPECRPRRNEPPVFTTR